MTRDPETETFQPELNTIIF